MKTSSVSTPIVLSSAIFNTVMTALFCVCAYLNQAASLWALALMALLWSIHQWHVFICVQSAWDNLPAWRPFDIAAIVYFGPFLNAVITTAVSGVLLLLFGVRTMRVAQPVIPKYPLLTLAAIVFALIGYAILVHIQRRKTKVVKGRRSLGAFCQSSRQFEWLVLGMQNGFALIILAASTVLAFASWVAHTLMWENCIVFLPALAAMCCAVFLGIAMRSLLIDGSADPMLLKAICQILMTEESIHRLIHIKSLLVEAEHILLAIKIEFNSRLNSQEIQQVIGGLEREIKNTYPVVKTIVISPYVNPTLHNT